MTISSIGEDIPGVYKITQNVEKFSDHLPRLVRHVLGQVGQQHSQVEADLLGGLVKSLREANIVHFAVVVGLTTGKQEGDLLTEE